MGRLGKHTHICIGTGGRCRPRMPYRKQRPIRMDFTGEYLAYCQAMFQRLGEKYPANFTDADIGKTVRRCSAEDLLYANKMFDEKLKARLEEKEKALLEEKEKTFEKKKRKALLEEKEKTFEKKKRKALLEEEKEKRKALLEEEKEKRKATTSTDDVSKTLKECVFMIRPEI